jgi:hypothetical protein
MLQEPQSTARPLRVASAPSPVVVGAPPPPEQEKYSSLRLPSLSVPAHLTKDSTERMRCAVPMLLSTRNIRSDRL